MASSRIRNGECSSVRQEVAGLVYIFLGLFTLLSLVTFDPLDPSLNQVTSKGGPIHNGGGIAGAYLAGILIDFFGVGAFAWPVAFLALAFSRFVPPHTFPRCRWVGLGLTTCCLMSWDITPWPFVHFTLAAVQGGGFLGHTINRLATGLMTPDGVLLIWLFIFFCALQLLSGVTWLSLGKRLNAQLIDFLRKRQERLLHREKHRRRLLENREALQSTYVTNNDTDNLSLAQICDTVTEGYWQQDNVADEYDIVHGNAMNSEVTSDVIQAVPSYIEAALIPVSPAIVKPQSSASVSVEPAWRSPDLTIFPNLDLLTTPLRHTAAVPLGELRAMAETLTACLADFGVQGEVQSINPGPVITMFEYRPAPGVKISRISNLSDDLALALKAMAVRIEAPIPGKNLVGIEIPSTVRQTVFLRDIFASDIFQRSSSLLTMALGVDIAGQPCTADLARMPHLLVAGATGAGKSVCLNSIILSFLFKARPDQVKLLLVDPKRIELAVYADLPHLVHPVVTDMNLVKSALDWAVYEMEQRYDAMARIGVRNIESYNSKINQFVGVKKGESQLELLDLETMPYLVIIIDELADIMLIASKEIETSVIRLAQLARAAGIHMILATQRPSVDVVTGLIKANFPCRISFQVTSKHDARTILDTVGSERLLGKGDMLFKSGGGKLQRMHGAFINDEDVAAVVGFWKTQATPNYRMDFSEWKNSNGIESDSDSIGSNRRDITGDPIYAEAVDFVINHGKASISLVQRRFRIGYNRAARFIEQMEADGFVGAADGSKPRPILKAKR